MKELAAGVYLIEGSVNGGALVHGRHAILIDMPEMADAHSVLNDLRTVDADIIDMVLLTQGRRSFCGGLFQDNGPALAAASQQEADALSTAGDACRSKGKKYLLHAVPPYHRHPFENCSVECILADGDVREWNEFSITCVVVGAQAAGETIYVVTNNNTGERYAFCGNFIMTGSKIPELYNLRRPQLAVSGDNDHHEGIVKWQKAAQRLRKLHPDKIIPAYGTVIDDPMESIDLLEKRLVAYDEDENDETLAELLPADIGLGLDPNWIRIYPAAQTVHAGEKVQLAVQVTGHGVHEIEVKFRMPWQRKCENGITQDRWSETITINTTGTTSGSTLISSEELPRDYEEVIEFSIPEGVHGERFIPADCFIDGHYLGSWTYAELVVE